MLQDFLSPHSRLRKDFVNNSQVNTPKVIKVVKVVDHLHHTTFTTMVGAKIIWQPFAAWAVQSTGVACMPVFSRRTLEMGTNHLGRHLFCAPVKEVRIRAFPFGGRSLGALLETACVSCTGTATAARPAASCGRNIRGGEAFVLERARKIPREEAGGGTGSGGGEQDGGCMVAGRFT